MDKPSIGRIVHYVEVHGSHHAAIITGVRDGRGAIDLAIFHNSLRGTLFVQDVGYEWPGEHPNTWHWPEREG